jgi:hypothetical protein
MTASPASARAGRLGGARLAAALPALLLAACTTPAGAPVGSAFQPATRTPVPPPDVVHSTAAEIARAALVSDQPDLDQAIGRLQDIETVLAAVDQPPTGLVPIALDLRNTTLDNRHAYRGASAALLERDDLDDFTRKRLETFRADDPLQLAHDRMRDVYVTEFARAFNALAEPIGQSIMTAQLAPYRLGRSLVNYAVQVYTRQVFSVQRRQALAHWKEFLARNPDAPEAEEIEPKVREAQSLWALQQRNHALRVARKALDADRMRLALVYADRALRYVPEDREASELRDEAARRLLEIRDGQRRSLDAAGTDLTHVAPQEQRDLAVALLAPGGDISAAARRLEAADPDGPLCDEARFAEAVALGEAGDDEEMWKQLDELSKQDPESSNMARHAAALVNNPQINTWRAFSEARSRDRWSRVSWVFLGSFFQGPRDIGLPAHLEWVVSAPSIAESVLGTPMRLINVPWAKSLPSARVAATLARRHLERNPDDPRSADVRDWLEGYETKRGNWIGALELEEGRSDADLAELAALREKAAQQYLEAAVREPNVALRIGMYRRLNDIYPGSRAARLGGELARTESDEVTAQRIRLSRGFLEENPEITGPRGLALKPELMDDDSANSELHPYGVTFLGGRVVEVSYLAASGKKKDPPRRVREQISEEQLARVVSLLEETSYRNMLVDPLNDVSADASRDLFFERARLGLADEVDRRPEAISQYTYTGVRERYGMVRTRESILPFDIVVQGNLNTLSLGAFPRIRTPKETPDAMLYK